MQWQDGWGDWHDVVGWRGGLDAVLMGENRKVVGTKVWWVANSDMGKGPFRWIVYPSPESKLVAASEAFYLPHHTGATVWVSAPASQY